MKKLIVILFLALTAPVHANYEILLSIANITMHNSLTLVQYEEARDCLKRAIDEQDLTTCLQALEAMRVLLLEQLECLQDSPHSPVYVARYNALNIFFNSLGMYLHQLMQEQPGNINVGLLYGSSLAPHQRFLALPKPQYAPQPSERPVRKRVFKPEDKHQGEKRQR